MRRQIPKVEIVLEPRVQHAELDHRVQLLRDHRLGFVRAQLGRRHLERDWKLVKLGIGHDRVTEADVDLHSHARSSEFRLQLDSDAVVDRLFPDRLSPNAFRFERDAVIDRRRRRAHGTENVPKSGQIR